MQLVKTTPLKLSPLPSIPETIKEVIYDMLNALAAYHAPEEGKKYDQTEKRVLACLVRCLGLSSCHISSTFSSLNACSGSVWLCFCTAERGEERANAVPGNQDLCQILQDVGDDVYQQYRLTRQGSDFDSQSAFPINVRAYMLYVVVFYLCVRYVRCFTVCISCHRMT